VRVASRAGGQLTDVWFRRWVRQLHVQGRDAVQPTTKKQGGVSRVGSLAMLSAPAPILESAHAKPVADRNLMSNLDSP
jgi:hypothetical protein